MKKSFNKLCRFSMALTAVLWVFGASAADNPRSVSTESGARTSRAASRVVSRGAGNRVRTDDASTSRVAAQSKKVIQGRGVDAGVHAPRSLARQSIIGVTNRSAISAPRSAMTAISRAVVRPFGGATNARSAKRVSNAGFARAASTARATAVFSDISKIGGGYASCRESYATCMDQFCANANDTFRRCYCSEKFRDFRDTEDALDQAKVLLQQFEDNNLNAVDKSAAEVSAMYSATAGEAAIKTDVSGAQSLLNSIGDLLSGKKTKLETPQTSTSGSMGIMDLDFSTSMDDIWGGGGDLFADNSSSATDMTALEGLSLYNTSNKQCVEIIGSNCENQAMLNMATSAYGIMIAQDCNMYEKNVEKKREQVKQAVRQAEKVLRDARLEEYRAHNSADVNECLTKVQNAIKTDVACGPNYERCLDYTGQYINISTGEPIYSPQLFDLTGIIRLDGSADVLESSPEFAAFLDERKMFATTALDSCRSIADTVWTEFKRVALIEIAQAQDEKIEEVKMSCVSTMAECYDRQAGALKSFDTTESQVTGAISAYAAKSMCEDKVAACANLYGCKSSMKDGKVTVTESCPLWAFVDAVDNVRVAEGCADGVQKYVNDLCTPSSGDKGFPWNCRNIGFAVASSTAAPSQGVDSSVKSAVTPIVARAAQGNQEPPKVTVTTGYTPFKGTSQLKDTFEGMVQSRAKDLCWDPTDTTEVKNRKYDDLPAETRRMVDGIISDTKEQLFEMLETTCEELNGYWYSTQYNENEDTFSQNALKPLAAFYSNVYGRTPNASEVGTGPGACIENTKMIRCESYNSGEGEKVATYDAARDECNFTEAWYQNQCETVLGGYYEGGICYYENSGV